MFFKGIKVELISSETQNIGDVPTIVYIVETETGERFSALASELDAIVVIATEQEESSLEPEVSEEESSLELEVSEEEVSKEEEEV